MLPGVIEKMLFYLSFKVKVKTIGDLHLSYLLKVIIADQIRWVFKMTMW